MVLFHESAESRLVALPGALNQRRIIGESWSFEGRHDGR